VLLLLAHGNEDHISLEGNRLNTATETTVTLDWENENGNVTVTPADQDRFAIKMRKAIQILQVADKVDQFEQQFNLLLSELGRWLSERDGIEQSHVTLRDGAFAFVVVRSNAAYDEDFENDLSALDFRLANDVDLELISLFTVALPAASEASISSFLDPAFTLTYGRE